ncbi:MAG: FAD-dependent oxidoreductase [Limnochordaceae bacterium]|nr:FAD-dependent oxidoreductase [Limnochordaceae bacterium]
MHAGRVGAHSEAPATLEVRQYPGSTAAAGETVRCSLLIVGGGTGAVAAAVAAAAQGLQVVMTEPTFWLGGQLTSQGVSALDEHSYIETFGGTSRYNRLRQLIRAHYRQRYSLTAEAASREELNPGNAWVSRLCFEPQAGLAAIATLLQEAGQVQVYYGTTPLAVERSGRRIQRVRFQQRLTPAQAEALRQGQAQVATLGCPPPPAGQPATPPWLLDEQQAAQAGYETTVFEVEPTFVIDATELGDLLPLAGLPYRSGAEARSQTGEPHAKERPESEWVQSFTYPFAVEYCPGERHVIPKPEGYEALRDRQPYTFRLWYGEKEGWKTYGMFQPTADVSLPFWTYRRLIDRTNFTNDTFPHDIAMINWPGNDFRHANLIDRNPAEQASIHRQAKLLSLGFLYWLQTEAPRDEGGQGYPELRLRPDIMGSADGLSQYPYIRESRRIVALTTVVEQDVAAEFQPGPRAAHYLDTAGIGFYPIDIHAADGETDAAAEPTRPFEIPLGALIPADCDNLLAGAKNIGTTHITNGCYRLHPVEWNIGETAGLLAAYCLQTDKTPAQIRSTLGLLRRFQGVLVGAGVPLFWFVDVPPGHPAFAAVHRLAATGVLPGAPDIDPAGQELYFHPDEPATLACLDSWLAKARPLFPELGLDELARQALARELLRDGELYKSLLPEELEHTLTRGELAQRLFQALLPSLESVEDESL